MKNFVLAVCAGIFVCLPAKAQLNGQVIDAEDERPVPFAAVVLLDFQIGVICDSSGHFSFKNDLPEQFTVKISAAEFETLLLTVHGSDSLQTFLMSHRHTELNEVTASTPKSGLQSRNATYVESRRMDQLQEIPATSMGEALQRMPGVYNSSSGTGVSKPVIRGLQGTRIVTLLNGVRLENQQWGSDHDMGVTSLGIGAVELIKGPSSLLYGADALGGVLYFKDEDYAQQGHYSLTAKSTFESNTMGTNNELGVKLSGKNVRLNVAGSYVNHADFMIPAEQFVENSRFNGYGAKLAFGANRKRWVTHLRYGYSKQFVGIIGEHEHGEEEGEAEEHSFFSDEQARKIAVPFQRYENHLLSWENKWLRKRHEWQLLLGQSYNRLSELEESADTVAMQLDLLNTTYSLRYLVKLNERFQLIGGLQGAIQSNVNKGAEEELIPNTQQFDNGIYALAYFTADKWDIQGGMRYDYRVLHAGIDNDSLDFTKWIGAFNFALGAVRDGAKNTFRVNISSGVRMPHVSEWLTDGVHHGALRYEKGDVNLRPERAVQLDLSDEIHGEHLEIVLNPFASVVQDFIYLQALDSVIADLPVYQYQQLKQAYFAGIDVAVHYHPHFAHWLHWLPSVSFLYAQDAQGNPIPFIPQARILNEVKFTVGWKGHPKALEMLIQDAFYLDQYRVSGLETPTRRYHSLNAGINIYLLKKRALGIGAGVKNVFNAHYVDHLSRLKQGGIPAPGRNIYLRLTLNLEGSRQKR